MTAEHNKACSVVTARMEGLSLIRFYSEHNEGGGKSPHTSPGLEQ